MFGVGGKSGVNADKGGLAAPVIDSVDANLSVCNNTPAGSPVGFGDCMTLSGGAIVEADTEYLYTHFADGSTGPSPPTFPGAAWTAYTQNAGDRAVDWDSGGAENGPLNQPTAAGPYTGATPWNDGKNDPTVITGDGGGTWKRIEVTVKNAAGQDTAAVFYQDDCF